MERMAGSPVQAANLAKKVVFPSCVEVDIRLVSLRLLPLLSLEETDMGLAG